MIAGAAEAECVFFGAGEGAVFDVALKLSVRIDLHVAPPLCPLGHLLAVGQQPAGQQPAGYQWVVPPAGAQDVDRRQHPPHILSRHRDDVAAVVGSLLHEVMHIGGIGRQDLCRLRIDHHREVGWLRGRREDRQGHIGRGGHQPQVGLPLVGRDLAEQVVH